MKETDVIRNNMTKIADHLTDDYRDVLRHCGNNQHKVYIWDDGNIEDLEQPQGSCSYLKARDNEPRQLIYITTVEARCFDPFDFVIDDIPDSKDERENLKNEVIDMLVEEYRHTVYDLLASIIREIESRALYTV